MEKNEERVNVTLMTIMAVCMFYGALVRLSGCSVVNGESMEPTLHECDIVSCQNVSQNGISRGDIVIFDRDGRRYIKRVIGIPGDTISISDGQFEVNGSGMTFGVSAEPYDRMDKPGILSNGPLTLGADEYFCAGDNRNHSKDSRVLGAIKYAEIDGKVTKVYTIFH